MNRLVPEFRAETHLSPIELEGLKEVETWNASRAFIDPVDYVECETVPNLSANGHQSLGRIEFAQSVTSQFIKKPDARRWRLTERPHKHESLNHNPQKRALVSRRKAHTVYVKRIDGEKKSLPNNIPAWRLRIPPLNIEPQDSYVEKTVLDWKDPQVCMERLESQGELEAVVDFTPDIAAIAGREVRYISQITAAPYIPPYPKSL